MCCCSSLCIYDAVAKLSNTKNKINIYALTIFYHLFSSSASTNKTQNLKQFLYMDYMSE